MSKESARLSLCRLIFFASFMRQTEPYASGSCELYASNGTGTFKKHYELRPNPSLTHKSASAFFYNQLRFHHLAETT
jgi:hypothetical protein